MFEHTEQRNHFIEAFSVESWLEHLSQQERVTDEDRVLQADIRALRVRVAVCIVHWFLRIALASVFIYHGLLKFLNLEGFTQMLPISYLEVVLVAVAETGGGLLVLLLRIGSLVSQGVQENNRPAAGYGAQRCSSEIGAT